MSGTRCERSSGIAARDLANQANRPYAPAARATRSSIGIRDPSGRYDLASARAQRQRYLASVAVSVIVAYIAFVLVNTHIVGFDTSVPFAPWLYLQDGLDIMATSVLVVLATLALDRLLERDQRRLVATLDGLARVASLARRIGVAAEFRQQVRPIEEQTHRQVADLAATFGEMLTRLEEGVESQRRFLADTSHELRNPLTSLSMNLALLVREDVPPEVRMEAAREAQAEAAYMGRLVNDLLLLARGDAAELVQLEVVELEPLLSAVVQEASAGAGGGPQVMLGPVARATVLGDPGRLRQVLRNLLDNARRHTPADGTITLSLMPAFAGDDEPAPPVAALEPPASSGLARPGAAWVAIVCADTGSGIAPEHVPHVFERFYQADPARDRRGGAGLGLAIVKHLVEAHGGRVALESTLGTGTTVTILLPVAHAEA